ncbi:MAG: hypothetical protein ABJE00_16810 [Erythrobacter sp.]
MRDEVANFLKLGPLPTENCGDENFEQFEQVLDLVKPPLTDEEASALHGSFGEDSCYGLAWELVHLIETSPTPFPEEQPAEGENEWLHLLYQRYFNSLGAQVE